MQNKSSSNRTLGFITLTVSLVALWTPNALAQRTGDTQPLTRELLDDPAIDISAATTSVPVRGTSAVAADTVVVTSAVDTTTPASNIVVLRAASEDLQVGATVPWQTLDWESANIEITVRSSSNATLYEIDLIPSESFDSDHVPAVVSLVAIAVDATPEPSLSDRSSLIQPRLVDNPLVTGMLVAVPVADLGLVLTEANSQDSMNCFDYINAYDINSLACIMDAFAESMQRFSDLMADLAEDVAEELGWGTDSDCDCEGEENCDCDDEDAP